MPFFDAHCDTIGPIWDGDADFLTGERGGSRGGYTTGALHVTLPGLRSAGICAQVFASWVWSRKYKGEELEVGLAKVEAVRRLCDEHSADLYLALRGAEIAETCRSAAETARTDGEPTAPPGGPPKTAVIASLEGSDALQGDIDNLDVFYNAGVRLITFAWDDNDFIGSTYGEGGGLTNKGADLVSACEERGVLVDVSHASDKAFWDVCRAATRPFLASHSNCRRLCPSGRNLTDEMIRALGERGGVMCITLAPGFLSRSYYELESPLRDRFRDALVEGSREAMREYAEAVAAIPRPPLELIVDHVRHAINVGGEDAVGLGGDLDGVETLPDDFAGVADYPRISALLHSAGLRPSQIDKVCYGNLARLFKEGLE